MKILFLGISGVLHPSASIYELIHGASPWDVGHKEYEAATWLETALARWSDIMVILTSTQPVIHGLPSVLTRLGPLANRVIGYTFQDLTRNATRTIRTRSGTTRSLPHSVNDYWRMSKGEIVVAHLNWSRPAAWVAVDDEDIGWPVTVRGNVCIVDGCKGLAARSEQSLLLGVLSYAFGSPP